MYDFILRIIKGKDDTATICIPETRLSRAEAVKLRCRIEKMRAFKYQRMIIENGLYQYIGIIAPFSAARIQGIGIRINKFIDQIKAKEE